MKLTMAVAALVATTALAIVSKPVEARALKPDFRAHPTLGRADNVDRWERGGSRRARVHTKHRQALCTRFLVS